MRAWTTRYLPWLLVVALFAVAAALHVRTVTATETPESAVRTAIESRGESYAGDCAATVSPGDIGKTCSRFVEERGGDRRAYIVGRTFSEFSRWVFVAQDGGSWKVLGEAPLRFDAQSLDVPWP